MSKEEIKFTGERVVEGRTPLRIWFDHMERYEFAGNYVQEKNVLDISCGTGYGSFLLKNKRAKTVVGVDISNEAVNFAQEKYKTEGLEFKTGNILKTGYMDNFFDVIVCFETIEHVDDHLKVFLELFRILKPGGLLLISTPNRKITSPFIGVEDTPNNSFHIKEYNFIEFVESLQGISKVIGIYGQRPILKILLHPFIHKIFRKICPFLYNPGKGSPNLEQIKVKNEYRYITLICQKQLIV